MLHWKRKVSILIQFIIALCEMIIYKGRAWKSVSRSLDCTGRICSSFFMMFLWWSIQVVNLYIREQGANLFRMMMMMMIWERCADWLWLLYTDLHRCIFRKIILLFIFVQFNLMNLKESNRVERDVSNHKPR